MCKVPVDMGERARKQGEVQFLYKVLPGAVRRRGGETELHQGVRILCMVRPAVPKMAAVNGSLRPGTKKNLPAPWRREGYAELINRA